MENDKLDAIKFLKSYFQALLLFCTLVLGIPIFEFFFGKQETFVKHSGCTDFKLL